MTQIFSPSEAALSVLTLAKRQPQFVMRFAMLYAGMTAIYLAVMTATGVGEAMTRFAAVSQPGMSPSPAQIEEILMPVMPGFGLVALLSLVLSTFLTTMALRKVVDDVEVGFWGLQLGNLEGRYLVASIGYGLILFATAIVVSIVSTILISIHPALTILGFLTGAVLIGWVALRLSQFGVLAAVTGTMGLKQSFNQTQGRTWHYLGAYVLWAVIAIIVGMIGQGLATVGASALGARIGSGIPQSMADFLTAGWLFYILVYGMVTGFLTLGFTCIGAYAWHQSQGAIAPPKSADF